MRIVRVALVVSLAFCGVLVAQQKPPAARLVTAASAPDIKLTSEVAEWTADLQIEAPTADGAKNVHVEITDLTGPQTAKIVTCTVAGQPCATPFEIGPLQSVPLHLEAALPVPGTYSAFIAVVGASRDMHALSVTRTAVFPLKLMGADKAQATTGDITLRVALQESTGRDATLAKPALLLLTRKDAKGSFQATYDSAVVKDARDRDIGDSWMIWKNQPTELRIAVNGLKDPGEYNGTLRIAAAPESRLDVPISILVREPWTRAAALIFLGVLVSFLLRSYLKYGRGRLVNRRTVLRLRQDLTALREEIASTYGAVSPDEASLLDALDRRVARLVDGADETGDDVVTELRDKIRFAARWVPLRRRAQSLAGEARKEVDAKLTDVRQKLQKSGVDATIETSLKELETKIPDALRDQMNARIAELERQLPSAPADVQAKVKAALASAKSAVADKRFDDASRDIAAAAKALARVIAEALRARLGAATRPLGFDTDADWDAVKKSANDALTVADALTDDDARLIAYRKAYGEYLAAVSAKLVGYIDGRVNDVKTHRQITEQERTALLDSLGTARKGAADVTTQVAAGQIDEAAKTYAAAAAAVKTADGAVAAKGGVQGAPGGATADAAPTPGAVALFDGGFLAPFGFFPKTLAGTNWALWLGDASVALVVLGIAVLLGLQLLWVPKLTWGGADDYLLAVLWGLGLHQVSGAAFEGTGGLVNRFAA
jgi:hypothetical protein